MFIVERPKLLEMIVTPDEYSSLKDSPEFVIFMAIPDEQNEKFCVTYWFDDGGPTPMCLKNAA